MKKGSILIFLFFTFICTSFKSYSAVYRAIASGDWTDSAIWDVAPFDGIGGDGIPGAVDVAITNDFQIGLDALSGDIIVGRLTVSNDVSNSIFYSDPFFTSIPVQLTINLSLSSTGSPTTQIIENNPNLSLVIAGTGTSVINNWSATSPFNNLTFNSGGSTTINSNIAVDGGDLTIANGTNLTLGASNIFSNPNSNSNLVVESGSTLIVNGAINGDGTNTSRFGNVTINGTVNTGVSGYINAVDFNLNSTGLVNINFNGANQTQGWWYQSTFPTGTFNIDAASTVNYRASADQVVGATTYGNLTLSSPASSSVKSLQAGNTFVVSGTFRINSANVTFNSASNSNPISLSGGYVNNGTWSSSQLVIFNGSSAQSINGNNLTTFGAGIRVSNTSGLSLSNIGVDINGELDVDPNCSFDPSDQNVNVSGNLRIDGSLIAGSNPGIFEFDGVTEFLGSGNRDFRNLTITNTLTAPEPVSGDLNISGVFTNDGTFINNSGIVNMTGTGSRSIAGSSPLSLFNLNVSGGTVNINNASVAIEDGITVDASSTLDLDGSGSGQVTLISTASKDAYIAEIPASSSVVGELTVQRALYTTDAGDNAYHVVGFPMTGVTVSDIQAEMPITGTFTGRSTGTGFDNNPSLYAYNETAGSGLTLNERYVAFPNSNNSETFTVGEGYYLYTYPGIIPVTIDGSGVVFSGDFSRSLSFTGSDPDAGWHIVANPYPAPTDWQNWGKTDIEGSTAYVYNSNNGNFIAYDGSSQQLVPQGQGFWVRATSGSAEVNATEATKVVSSTPVFYRGEQQDRFEIILKTPDYDDISIVHFTEGATDNYESAFDATRLLNTYETISTLSNDGNPLKVNRMAAVNSSDSCRRSLFINLEQLEAGTNYQLDFKGLGNIEEYHFELIDHRSGNTQLVNDEGLIDFTIESSQNTTIADRFELVFVKNAPVSFNISDVASCFNETVNIDLPTLENNTNYYVFNDSGELVKSFDSEQTELNLIAEELNEGVNQYTLKASNALCDTVEIDSFVVNVSSAIDKSRAVSGSNICYSAMSADYSINTQNGITYYLIQENDTLTSVDGNGDELKRQLDVNLLKSGDNNIAVLAVQENCNAIYLDQTIDIYYDTFQIDESIVMTGSKSCDVSDASISLNTQDNVSYLFELGNIEIQTVEGDGSELILALPDSLLESGVNDIYITADYKDCQTFTYQPVSVVVHEQMTISGVENINICKEEELALSIQSNVTASEFELRHDNQIVLTSTTGSISFVPEVSGNYLINAISENGCVSNELSFNITLDSISQPEIIASDNILESSINAETYQWYKDDILLEGETSRILIVEASGDYKVEAFSNLCSEMSEAFTFDERVLLTDKEFSGKLSLYPNPVQDNLIIELKDNDIDSMEITIFDVSGKFISSHKQLSNHSELDLTYLKSGTYLIEITTKKGLVTKRIVKQ